MNSRVAVVCGLVLTGALAAQEATDPVQRQREKRVPKPSSLTQYQTPQRAQGRLEPRADYEEVHAPKLMRYRHEDDYPDYSRYFDGNGIEVGENGEIPRSDALIGVETGRISGGGCMPDPADPQLCQTFVDASGNQQIIWKEREMWTFRVSYIDPSVSNAPEVNIGFAGSWGYVGDDQIGFIRRTEGGRSCFTFYPCDYYGVDLTWIEGSVRAFQPHCGHKRGAGYRMQVFYQASRYRFGEVPAGAAEWEPATIPATATRLEKPGKILWTRNFEIGPGENALAMAVPGLVHPAVPNTGYPTVAPSVAPGTGTVTVSTYDCGPIPNVSFNIAREFVDGSGGHDHTNEPSLDRVSSLAAYSGTTDAEGKWTTTLTAGDISSAVTYKASTPDLLGKPAESGQSHVTTGFVGLIDPGDGTLDADIRYTGATAEHGTSHHASHELHEMVRTMATYYNIMASPGAVGSIGINDMSLPLGGIFDISGAWATPHSRHRIGTDSDIDRNVQRPDGTFVPLEVSTLESIVRDDLGGVFILESGGRMHVQVPEYQVADILLRGTR